jgi:outer membrane cobalamin receptor
MKVTLLVRRYLQHPERIMFHTSNRRRSLKQLPLYATLVLAACASSGQDVETPRSSTWSNVIARSEITESAASNALEVVQRLRPRWLQAARGLRPVPYIDDQRANFTWLGSLHTDRIEEIRFLHGRDATTLWGTNHPGGVIHVITRDRPNEVLDPRTAGR